MHGVTASGKTAVYLKLVENVLNAGKNALICIPEIGLTPQSISQFKNRFDCEIAVIHSGLTKAQKEKEWSKIYHNEVRIVIGARSAMFTPLENIGIIIIDEAHDGSYKQDQHPRYQTDHIAMFRAHYHNCPLLLGSATPRVDHFHEYSDQFSIISLPNRVHQTPLPKIEIVDMKSEWDIAPGRLISQQLLESITETIQSKQKVMLLINRRGFATHISCQFCNDTLVCPGCNLSYTYHRDQSFHCHRCMTKIPMTHTCPSCQKPGLQFKGVGIQKLETELKKALPDAYVVRIDKDKVKKEADYHALFNEFIDKGDILVGTQLIAKGHDFKPVNLVGVIGIDSSLHLPDFRSAERTFQLITQVAGRAGRDKTQGRVIIQTAMPDHYAVQFAKTHDFLGFYQHELKMRKQLYYPPYSRLILVIISSKSITQATQTAATLTDYFNSAIPAELNTMVLGPVPAPVEQINGYHRMHILLKFNPKTDLYALQKIIQNRPSFQAYIRVIIDTDPLSLL